MKAQSRTSSQRAGPSPGHTWARRLHARIPPYPIANATAPALIPVAAAKKSWAGLMRRQCVASGRIHLLDRQFRHLKNQVGSIRKEQLELDTLITETRLIVGKVEKDIEQNQGEIDSLNEDLRIIIKEMQKRNNESNIKLFFSSRSLGDMLSEIAKISSLPPDLETKKQQIQVVNDKLKINKEQNTKIKDQLEKTRALLKSRESSLTILLEQTQDQQSKYQQLLDSIKKQKTELESQLGTIKGEYLAEIQEIKNNTEIKNDPTANCSFEEKTQLNVPAGYFGKPTNGYITQYFHCNHDGVDIANQMGTDLFSIAPGVVEKKGANNTGCVGLNCNGGFGNYVFIKHELPSGQVVYSMYAHMQIPSDKKIGQEVQKGEVVGKMGCTGYTLPYPCGVHLHFMMVSYTYENTGIACKFGGSTCYNPTKYIPGI